MLESRLQKKVRFHAASPGDGLRLRGREATLDGRGAAELAHCWTGYIFIYIYTRRPLEKTLCVHRAHRPLSLSLSLSGLRFVPRTFHRSDSGIYARLRRLVQREYVVVKVWFIFAHLQPFKYGPPTSENTAPAR